MEINPLSRKDQNRLSRKINGAIKKSGYRINSNFFETEILKAARHYGIETMMTSVDIAKRTYLHDPTDPEEVQTFLEKIVGVAFWRTKEAADPLIGELRKLSYIANKRWFTCRPKDLFYELDKLHKSGISIKDIHNAILTVSGITAFRALFEDIGEA